MIVRALSQTPFAADLMAGPLRSGVSLGHGHLLFGDRVLSLTRPGALRMPNGLACDVPVPEAQAPVEAGDARLVGSFGAIFPGPLWDPTPRPRFAMRTRPSLSLEALWGMAGRGPGLTPLGDDILTGYLGACALSGEQTGDLSALAASLAERTTSLSGTLLRLAALGQVPEAAHRLLEDGDPEALLSWGSSSGAGLLAGLGLGLASDNVRIVRCLDLLLPFDPPLHVHVEIGQIPGSGVRALPS